MCYEDIDPKNKKVHEQLQILDILSYESSSTTVEYDNAK